MKITSFLKENSLSGLIQRIGEETDSMKLFALENILLVQIIAPIFFIGTFVSFILGHFWDKPMFVVLRMSLTLFFATFLLIKTVSMQINETLKRHILSVILTLVAFMAYMSYYLNIGSMYWLFIVLLMLPMTLSSSKITILYIFVFSVIAVYFSFDENKISMIEYNQVYYTAVMFVMFFLGFAIMMINHLYHHIIKTKIAQYKKIIGQQEELTSLYEEIVASEEELREQNEKLNEYNAEIRENEKRLNYLANQDALTGLANRKMMMEQVELRIHDQDRLSNSFALVFIDLDNFKKINDTLGHNIGDEVLIALGKKLSDSIHKRDILGRLGGDEFALLITQYTTEESLYSYVKQLVDLIVMPFKIYQYEVKLSASFGVSIYPSDGETAEELLRSADTAMYKVKDNGKNDLQFFRPYMKEEILDKIKMEYHLIKALKQEELYLEFQPLIYTQDESIKGFEALIRWNSPEFGIVSPAKFIPMAEELGLIYEIGQWVFNEVCHMSIAFEQKCGRKITMNINVSALQLNNPNFMKDVNHIINISGVDPECIEVEITESVFIHDMNQAKEILNELRKLGIRIAIDDFGTGYSSLNYLMELPINTLKLDKSFIDKIILKNNKRNVVDSIIDMAHNLDIKVVAEGVEKQEQVDYLTRHKCDIIQGFYYSKPLAKYDVCHYSPTSELRECDMSMESDDLITINSSL